ncbi:MAG: hypothetical protein M1113_01750 [Candidatus Thermoplasmatota archaeon]|nr:hypothetical protein [Candidatus Thermoplasmatota archaeon]
MENNDLMSVLCNLNKEMGSIVDDSLLSQVIALVMKNPLDEDRGRCQEQILELLNQKVREEK